MKGGIDKSAVNLLYAPDLALPETNPKCGLNSTLTKRETARRIIFFIYEDERSAAKIRY